MRTLTKSRATRKPARETHGKCFLTATGNLTLQQALDSGGALLTLHTDTGVTNYTVLRLADKDGRTVGYRLTKLTRFIADRQVYDIDVTQSYGWQCDCPDATFQSHECKHCRALQAALAVCGITVAAAKPQPAPKSEAPKQQPAAREPWCRHCNDERGKFCSYCSL